MSVGNIVQGYYKIDTQPGIQSHHQLNDLTTYDDHPQYWKIPSRNTDTLTIPNTTPSNDTATGALVVYGGAAVAGNLNVGGNVNLSGGNLSVSNDITSYSITSTTMYCNTTPANSNNVIRLIDIYPQRLSITGGWTTDPSSGLVNNTTTLYIEPFGSYARILSFIPFNFTTPETVFYFCINNGSSNQVDVLPNTTIPTSTRIGFVPCTTSQYQRYSPISITLGSDGSITLGPTSDGTTLINSIGPFRCEYTLF